MGVEELESLLSVALGGRRLNEWYIRETRKRKEGLQTTQQMVDWHGWEHCTHDCRWQVWAFLKLLMHLLLPSNV